MDVEPLCVRKTIYLPEPFLGVFLERNLMPAEACTCLRGATINGGQEVDCQLIIVWLRIALTKKVGDDKLPLTMPRPTAPLADGNLLCHWHHMLTRHLPGLDPSLQRGHRSIIVTHTG